MTSANEKLNKQEESEAWIAERCTESESLEGKAGDRIIQKPRLEILH